jgi:carbonic anhydrase
MDISNIISRLEEGNSRFVADKLDGKLTNSDRRNELTSGQSPEVIVLSCADSRVVPELAFDAGLGELFVIRVAGNVANSSSLASIEYAVAHLKSKLIVVMGHQSCGAVTAAIAGGDNGPNLNHLLSHVSPAVDSAPEGASVNEVVKLNARLTTQDLVNNSDIIKDAVNAGSVKIVPAYYNLDSGKVDFLD